MIDCKTASVSEIQKALWNWQHRNFPQYSNGSATNGYGLYTHLKYGVIEEMGEFFHAVLKRDQGIRGTKAEHDAAIRDAIGDMLIYTSQLQSCNDAELELDRVEYSPESMLQHATWLVSNLEGDDIESVLEAIEFLAKGADVDSVECFREAAEQVLARDWIAYPKNGKTE